MRLDLYDATDFNRGASWLTQVAWLLAGRVLASWLPGSAWRRKLLRLFSAKIGDGVVLKPGIRVKFPWRLRIGDHSWIGEGVWLDNLVEVEIGRHACLSQGVYVCTGSHDWSDPAFKLIVKPVKIEDGAWLGAFTRIAPGVTVGQGAVLSLGSVALKDLEGWSIYQGHPAVRKAERRIGGSHNVDALSDV